VGPVTNSSKSRRKRKREKGKVATLIRSKSLLKLDPMDGWMEGEKEAVESDHLFKATRTEGSSKVICSRLAKNLLSQSRHCREKEKTSKKKVKRVKEAVADQNQIESTT
jgi:hypothetical protein